MATFRLTPAQCPESATQPDTNVHHVVVINARDLSNALYLARRFVLHVDNDDVPVRSTASCRLVPCNHCDVIDDRARHIAVIVHRLPKPNLKVPRRRTVPRRNVLRSDSDSTYEEESEQDSDSDSDSGTNQRRCRRRRQPRRALTYKQNQKLCKATAYAAAKLHPRDVVSRCVSRDEYPARGFAASVVLAEANAARPQGAAGTLSATVIDCQGCANMNRHHVVIYREGAVITAQPPPRKTLAAAAYDSSSRSSSSDSDSDSDRDDDITDTQADIPPVPVPQLPTPPRSKIVFVSDDSDSDADAPVATPPRSTYDTVPVRIRTYSSKTSRPVVPPASDPLAHMSPAPSVHPYLCLLSHA